MDKEQSKFPLKILTFSPLDPTSQSKNILPKKTLGKEKAIQKNKCTKSAKIKMTCKSTTVAALPSLGNQNNTFNSVKPTRESRKAGLRTMLIKAVNQL